MHEIDPATVGQYINVTDKNGKRVFEGDIVQRLHWGNKVLVTPVVYDPEWNRFAVFSDGAESYGVTKYSDFEVIGNIHDKPELREAAK